MSYPRETDEFLAPTILNAGTPWTASFTYAITADDVRPTVWTAASQVGGKYGVWVRNLTPGDYHVWAKVSDNPETPVIDCGIISVS